MADGTFAVLLIVLGLTDMTQEHCGTTDGCLGRSDVTPRLAVSAGEVVKRRAKPAAETYMRYDLGHHNGPFGHAVGLSVGEKGEAWVGYGATYRIDLWQSGFYVELHTMPGLYFDNGGFDLGGMLAFRSGVELGFETSRGWRFALSYDHRSNAEIYEANPGIETVQYRVSIPSR
ncbi:MAG: hypothetical protein Marn2KO_36960 [Marinobacter nauticus]|tara:strand:- start:42 stop:563 length:522 start_codon:yes stop_codon:yes gene_type:complete